MTGQEPPRTLHDQDALDLAAERLAQLGRARRRERTVAAADRVRQEQRRPATPPAGLPTFEDITPSYAPMTFGPGSPSYDWDPSTGGMVRPVPPVARTHDETTARAAQPVPAAPPLEQYGMGRVQEVPPPPAPRPAPRAPRAVNLDMAERLGAAYAAALAERVEADRLLAEATRTLQPVAQLQALLNHRRAVSRIIATLDGQ